MEYLFLVSNTICFLVWLVVFVVALTNDAPISRKTSLSTIFLSILLFASLIIGNIDRIQDSTTTYPYCAGKEDQEVVQICFKEESDRQLFLEGKTYLNYQENKLPYWSKK